MEKLDANIDAVIFLQSQQLHAKVSMRPGALVGCGGVRRVIRAQVRIVEVGGDARGHRLATASSHQIRTSARGSTHKC